MNVHIGGSPLVQARRRLLARASAQATVIGLLVAAAFFGSLQAEAYSDLLLFPEHPALTGGGGGRFFTGSLQDGMTCEVCHVASAQQETPTLKIEGLPLTGYELGKKYTISVTFPPDRLSSAAAAEFVDVNGRQSGEVSAPMALQRWADELEPAEVFSAATNRTVFGISALDVPGFSAVWQAPATGERVNFHLAAVIGDESEDPLGDYVQVVHHELLPMGASTDQAPAQAVKHKGPSPRRPTIGCAVASDFSQGRWATLAGAIAVGFAGFARPRKKMGQAIVALIAGVLLTGCATVKPHERGRLAAPDMALDGNGDLLAGQRHGTDYREGSSGGFGGGGGGCGCN